jgi:hypothetical protein
MEEGWPLAGYKSQQLRHLQLPPTAFGLKMAIHFSLLQIAIKNLFFFSLFIKLIPIPIPPRPPPAAGDKSALSATGRKKCHPQFNHPSFTLDLPSMSKTQLYMPKNAAHKMGFPRCCYSGRGANQKSDNPPIDIM